MIHKGESRIRVDMPFDQEIIAKVKLIPGRRWSQTKKCWHLPDNAESKRYIQRLEELYPPTKTEHTPKPARAAAHNNKDHPHKQEQVSTDSAFSNPTQRAEESVYLTITPKKLFVQMPG